MLLTLPIFLPIIRSLGYDPVGSASLFNINMQIAYRSPPVRRRLLLLKGVPPPHGLAPVAAGCVRRISRFSVSARTCPRGAKRLRLHAETSVSGFSTSCARNKLYTGESRRSETKLRPCIRCNGA